LCEAGIESTLAILGGDAVAVSSLRDARVDVNVLGLRSLRHLAPAVAGLYRILRAQRFDLVHTHLAYANLYGRMAAFLARVPATCTYHGMDYEPETRQAYARVSALKLQAFRLTDQLSVRYCARVIAVSRFVAGSLSRHLGLSRSRIAVIHNGVAAPVAARADGGRQGARRDLGLPPDGLLAMQVGRLVADKGPLDTVKVAATLRGLPALRFAIIGDGPLRPALEAQIKESALADRVFLLGARADVSACLSAADVFLFPSAHEGLGIAALEAMRAGLPVVAYSVGPIPEVVIDGETGLLVDPGNAAGLAAAVERLLEPSLRLRLGAAGRARVAECFAIDDAARRYATFYAELLAVVRPVGTRY
jgi:glycosyltransferase involved in cell wall biosynthesis